MAHQDELHIERPTGFLKRERALQRVGATALTLFVLAGAAGAFGDGIISHATVRVDGTVVSYERFGRTSSATMIAISVPAATADGQTVRVQLDRQFLQQLSILELRPPDALKRFDDRSVTFEVPASGGRGHLELYYRPNHFGLLRATVASEASTPTEVWQLIYF